MMRVRSPRTQADDQTPLRARVAWLAAAAVFFSACSSAPLGEDADPGADSAGTGSGAASSGPDAGDAGSVDYQKRDYPPGPYGTGINTTLEDFAFLGWHDPVAANYDQTKLEQVRLSDYYDPTGSKGLKLIWINASAVWCSVCRAEMQDIRVNGVNAAFAAKGVQLIGTLFEDNKSGPARPIDLHNWGIEPSHSIDFPLLLDPGFKLGAFFTSDATPLNMLVDARTMRVIDATMGYSTDYWQGVDQLLTKLP
jgi:hypothetical protein